jgi:hypothetical protein
MERMSGNPYAPPTAQVADVDPGRPLPRPRAVSLAILLFWISVAVSLPLWFVDDAVDTSDPDIFVTLVIGWIVGLAMLAFTIWVIVSIGRARNWARITYLVLAILGWLMVIVDLPGLFASPWYNPFGYLSNAALDAAIVVLLFTPAANAWFRARGRGPADAA